MTVAGIAYVIGVLSVSALPVLPSEWLLWAAALAVPPLLWARRTRPLALLLVGVVWAGMAANDRLADRLDDSLQGRDLVVVGVVDSLPAVYPDLTRFELQVEAAVGLDPAALPRRLRLGWHRDAPLLRAGDRWRLTVRLKAPRGFVNPGGFDYERWLMQRRIGATGYVRASAQNRRLGTALATGRVHRLRGRLLERLDRALDGHPGGGLAAALVVGARDGVGAEQWETLRRTGTGHLLAISGLHVGLLAGFAYAVAAFAWRSVPPLALRAPASTAGALAGLTAAAGYALLAGLSLPTQRALIMLAVVLGAVLLRRPLRPLHGLGLALVVVLVFDPLAPLSASFWLSFAAVAVISLLLLGGQGGRGSGWRSLPRLQLALAVGLAPLNLLLFQQLVPASIPANLVAVPVVGLVIVPALLIGTVLLLALGTSAVAVVDIAAGMLARLLDGLALLAAQPWSAWALPAPPTWTLVPALVGLLWLLAPRGWPQRWLALPLLAPLVAQPVARPDCGQAWLWVLDVGMGSAAVLETCAHVMVYDTGPRWSERFDAGRAVLLPFLHNRGISALDLVVVSHGDGDHAGGTASLLAGLPAAVLVSGTPEQLDRPAESCRQGEAWQWDGVRFQWLHPEPDYRGSDNDRSCVLRVQTEGASALLTGDIGRKVERRLLAHDPGALRADVLVVPHHGSRSSSSPAFVAQVAPRLAVMSAGYRNRWGLPAAEVEQRYEQAGAVVARTDRDGALRVVLGAGVEPTPWAARAARARWWRQP